MSTLADNATLVVRGGPNSNNLGSSSKTAEWLGRGSEGSDLPTSPLEGVLRTYTHKIAKADSRANRQLLLCAPPRDDPLPAWSGVGDVTPRES